MGTHVIAVERYDKDTGAYVFWGEVYGPYATRDEAVAATTQVIEPDDKSFCVAQLKADEEFLAKYKPA